jgi:hypothetical protein
MFTYCWSESFFFLGMRPGSIRDPVILEIYPGVFQMVLEPSGMGRGLPVIHPAEESSCY